MANNPKTIPLLEEHNALLNDSDYLVIHRVGEPEAKKRKATDFNSEDGKSAYELAQDEGFTGSLAEWLLSLEGEDGEDAYQIAVANGFSGTQAEWLDSLKGENTYQIAVANGFSGTQAQWLNSLKGENAYQRAIANGFSGTEAQWLDSLKGTDGKSFNIEGELANSSALPASPDDNIGGYIIPDSIDPSIKELWVWGVSSQTWINTGPMSPGGGADFTYPDDYFDI